MEIRGNMKMNFNLCTITALKLYLPASNVSPNFIIIFLFYVELPHTVSNISKCKRMYYDAKVFDN